MMETANLPQTFRISQHMEEELRSLVGPDYIRAATVDDGVAGVQPQLVVSPGSERELASALRCANDAGIAVIPRGGGTKLSWGNAPRRGEIVLSTARLSRILEHAWADLTVSVEAGCTLKALQETLAHHGQRLALDTLWPERATVGGALATNDSGALRLRFGALRDLIIGVTLALPDGTLASSGGKVVKNVAGYDLPKLATGALGTLGVITRAVFRLHPQCPNTRTVSFSAANVQELQRKMLTIQDSKLAHTALQIRCQQGAAPVVDLLFEATDAGLSAQIEQAGNIVGQPRPTPERVWTARQDLWCSLTESSVIVKLSVLPAAIAKTIRLFETAATPIGMNWSAVFQATGLGWLRLDATGADLEKTIASLRADLEFDGGSLVIISRPRGASSLDAWGTPGDALPVMRALKQRLDPQNTLNPGRFVGGI